MDVDAAFFRRRQDLVGQDAAVGRHHDQLRGQFMNERQGRAVPQLYRLVDRDALGLGAELYRGRLELHAAGFWACPAG